MKENRNTHCIGKIATTTTTTKRKKINKQNKTNKKRSGKIFSMFEKSETLYLSIHSDIHVVTNNYMIDF